MTFVAAKCPGCGASIQLPDDRKSAACMYCASVVVVEEAVKLAASSGPDASTLIELGETSLAANRQEEAYGYFSRATELDPRNPTAWFGKAKASVGQATLGDMRTEEVVLCCKKFVELSSNDEISVVSASSVLTEYANMLTRAVDNHFEQFGGQLVGPMGSMVAAPVPKECSSWINRTTQAVNVHSSAIDLAEEHAKNALPGALRGVLRSITPFIHKAYTAKIKCTGIYTGGYSNLNWQDVAVQIDAEQRQSLFQVYEMYRNQLLQIDPESSTEFESIENIYAKQNEAKQNEAKESSSMCFVATACYGSNDAEPVRVLREFRDTILTSMIVGRAFIKIYYEYGPYVADFISTRRTLKVAVRRILCAPAALVASGILRIAKLRS